MHRAFFGASGLQPENQSLTLPIRAIFYFPWYSAAGSGWNAPGYTPATHYEPVLGYYDQYEGDVRMQHMRWIREANCDAVIVTWRGAVDNEDPKIILLLDAALQQGLKLCVQYDNEGSSNPSVGTIQTEFAYLAANYFDHPAYLHVAGLPVIFVYTNGGACELSQRYSDATSAFTTAYIVIDVVTSFGGCSAQPQGWYKWSSDPVRTDGDGYVISPGFWRYDSGTPVEPRDLTDWQTNVTAMVASAKEWKLVITFNEWAEGSGVEPTVEYGYDYLNALADTP